MTDNQIHDEPQAIEQDIRRTQEEMSRTVDKIGDQLSVKNVFNALLDKADQNGVDANYLIDGARRNPMALSLIAAGAIWLVSDKDSKFPSMPSRGKKPQAATEDEFDLSGRDVHHRDYVAHMGALQLNDGEDMQSYQRRRDLHRANFLMCEQRPDEDEHGFRQRLDEMTEQFRSKRRAWSDSVSQTRSDGLDRTQQLASQASAKAQDFYSSNPLVGGILAAAVGAALGTTIPISRQEQKKLGSIGHKARDVAGEQKDQLTSKAMEKKDQLLEQADQKLQSQGSGGSQGQDQQQSSRSEPAFQGAGSSSSAMSGGRTSGDGQQSTSEAPFIIPERNG